MKSTFISKKLGTLTAANTFQIGIDYVVVLCSNIIAGNILGGAALSAISLASPFLTFVNFASDIGGLGSSALVSYEIGRQDNRAANRYYSQGMIFSVFWGGILSVVYALMNTLIPNMFHVSAEMNLYYREYFQYLCILPLLQVPGTCWFTTVINNGGETPCVLSSIIRAISMIGLSVVLCAWMGVGGIGLATIFSYLLSRIPLFAFMFSKKCTLRFTRYFNFKSLGRAIKIGMSGAGLNMYLCLMRLVLNIFLLNQFGETSIVVFTVMMNIFELMLALFSSVGFSLSMPISLYRGEKLQTGIKKAMRAAVRTVVVEGVALTILLLACSGQTAGLFGITDAGASMQVTEGTRIFALSCLPFGLVLLFICYYSYIEKTRFAFGMTTLHMMALPVLMGILLGLAIGLRGVWWGISFSSIVAFAVLMLYAKHLAKESAFPLLLNKDALSHEYSYDVEKTSDGVMQLVDRVENDLMEHHLNREQTNRIMLMIEETQMLALQSGRQKNEVIECSILIQDGITLILRDSGSSSDPADESAPHIGHEHLLPLMLIGAHTERWHTLAGGKSRVVYKFPLTPESE